MLNFIVLALLELARLAPSLRVPDTLHTPELKSGALPRFADVIAAFHGSAANPRSLALLARGGRLGWFLFRTRRGFELRAVGLQPRAAEYAAA